MPYKTSVRPLVLQKGKKPEITGIKADGKLYLENTESGYIWNILINKVKRKI